jgi:hypothetical protein
MDIKPRVGDSVYYVSYGTPGGEFPSVYRAAIITEVKSDTEVSLFVMNPEGIFLNKGVTYSKEKKGGAWCWPEDV